MEDIQNKDMGNPNKNPEDVEPEVEEDILNEFGDDKETETLDPEELVQQNKELKTNLSIAIKQKRRYRDMVSKAPEDKPQKKVETEDLDQRIEAKLREREIEGLDTSDGIKEEIKKQLKAGTYKSVEEAKSSDYIQFLIQKEQSKQKEEKASISPTRQGGGAKIDFSGLNPKDIDITTSEGRKLLDEYTKWKDSH